VELLTVTRTSPLNAALKDGRVEPAGITLRFEEVQPITAAFRVMCRELAYDVCEMAATTYLAAREAGKPFTALPVFLTRGLHHGAIRALEPADPRSLEGKRVGVNRGYTVTTGLWARGILASEHGVDLDRITWVRSDAEHVAEYEQPPNVEDLPEGAELAEAVLSGELAAVVGDVKRPELVPLLADADEAAARYLRLHGVSMVNHLVVVRDDRLEYAPAVYDAFERAKALASDADAFPYGIEPNREVLEELVDHAVAQKIVRTRPPVDELFVALP
jgi:4,5-dihydroxyphthalate decarboxylase